MSDKSNTKNRTKQIRTSLKELSLLAKAKRENGEVSTINDGLKAIYSQQGHNDLRTFDQWKKAGRSVKRGEKAVYLWRKQTSFVTSEEGTEKEIFYFPFLAVFAFNQTYKIEGAK